MKKITKIASVAAVALMMTLTNGCKKEEMPVSGGAAANAEGQRITPTSDIARPVTLEVRMIGYDAGRYGSLECGIESIAVRMASLDPHEVSRWIEIPVKHLPVNVLNFNWEKPMNIADAYIPEGKVTEMKITFADKGVVAWGDRMGRHCFLAALTNTSVKIPVNGYVIKGKKLEVFLGFDVAGSLSYEGGEHPITIDPTVRALLVGNGKEIITENNK